MKTKIVAVLLSGCLTAGLAGTVTVQAKEKKVTKEEGEQITLELMDGTSETQYQEWEEEIIARFEEENPNIKIEITKVSTDSWNQTVMTRFASGDAPDLFTFTENDVADMVPSGYVMDLSESANIENYDEGMLDSLSVDGKVYALPISNDLMCVTYSKDVFEKAGITEVPKTWDAFMKVCETLKEQDIIPLVAGFADQWAVNGVGQTTYCAAVLGQDGPALADVASRKVTFAGTEQWKNTLTKISEMYPYMNEDLFGTDMNTCYDMVANGEAAMIPNISAAVNNVMSMNPDAEYGIFALPVADSEENNKMPMCPPAKGFSISESTAHKEEAMKFLEYLTSPESITVFAEKGAGIPIVKGVDTSSLTGAFKDGADMIQSGDFKLITGKSFQSSFEDAFIRDLSDFFLEGCKDVDAALEQMDTDFDNLQ